MEGDDLNLTPIIYDPLTRQFSIFSDDLDEAGLRTITVTATLDSLPEITNFIIVEIDIITPCQDPASITITAQPQTNPLPYSFAYDIPIFELVPPVIEPAYCFDSIVYECSLTDDSPRTDICDITYDGDIVVSQFDPATGNYFFQATDVDNYPPGFYTFEITARVSTAPTVTAVSTFELELRDACSLQRLRNSEGLTIDHPFEDQVYYFVEDN